MTSETLLLGSSELTVIILIIKAIFIAASVFFILHSGYLLYRLGLVKDKMDFYSDALLSRKSFMHKDVFLLEWEKIKSRMATMRESEYKLAIIEADKLFDILLQKMDYRGKDMGERLSQISPAQLSSIQGIWDSHKIRNLLAHDMNYHLSFSDAQKVIQNYERAFHELEILD